MAISDPLSGGDQFLGSIPVVYERLLAPMIFAEPARRMAAEVAELEPATILETAAGTGVLTRALGAMCRGSDVVATDLSAAMLEVAEHRQFGVGNVRWQQADALHLPFAGGAFDVVVCQFGVMFFPDRVAGLAETRRVLRPSGTFFFSAWDRVEKNDLAWAVTRALRAHAGSQAFDFITRVPHGYFDVDVLRDDLERAGLPVVSITTVSGTCTTTAADAAVAYCQGTPVRYEIEADAALDLGAATAVVEEALRAQFGDGTFNTRTSWLEVRAHP